MRRTHTWILAFLMAGLFASTGCDTSDPGVTEQLPEEEPEEPALKEVCGPTVEPEAGALWTRQESGTERSVTDITFLDGQTGRAIVRKWSNDAEPPLLLKTSDGGQTWCQIALSPHEADTEMGSALFFVDSDVGFIAGEDTRVMKTADGGLHWPINKKISDSYVSTGRAGRQHMVQARLDNRNRWASSAPCAAQTMGGGRKNFDAVNNATGVTGLG